MDNPESIKKMVANCDDQTIALYLDSPGFLMLSNNEMYQIAKYLLIFERHRLAEKVYSVLIPKIDRNESDRDLILLCYYGLGEVLTALERYSEADQAYSKVTSINPEDIDGHIGRALSYCNLDMFEEALSHFQRAIDIDPTEPDGHWGIGEALVRLEKYEEAVPYLLAAVELKPEKLEAQIALAAAFYFLGKLDLAEKHAVAALDLDPENEIAKNGLELIKNDALKN